MDDGGKTGDRRTKQVGARFSRSSGQQPADTNSQTNGAALHSGGLAAITVRLHSGARVSPDQGRGQTSAGGALWDCGHGVATVVISSRPFISSFTWYNPRRESRSNVLRSPSTRGPGGWPLSNRFCRRPSTTLTDDKRIRRCANLHPRPNVRMAAPFRLKPEQVTVGAVYLLGWV